MEDNGDGSYTALFIQEQAGQFQVSTTHSVLASLRIVYLFPPVSLSFPG